MLHDAFTYVIGALGLAGITNGTWQITEKGGHLRFRPALSGDPSGFGNIIIEAKRVG